MLETFAKSDTRPAVPSARVRDSRQRTPGDAHRHLDVLRRVELRQQMVELKDEPDVSIAELHELAIVEARRSVSASGSDP